jgi:hypothetical protein
VSKRRVLLLLSMPGSGHLLCVCDERIQVIRAIFLAQSVLHRDANLCGRLVGISVVLLDAKLTI